MAGTCGMAPKLGGDSWWAWQYSPLVEPWVPLFIVLTLGKLGLCLARTAPAASIPANLLLTLASEASFIVLTGVAAAAGCGCLGATGDSSAGSRGRAKGSHARPVRLCSQRRRLLLVRHDAV